MLRNCHFADHIYFVVMEREVKIQDAFEFNFVILQLVHKALPVTLIRWEQHGHLKHRRYTYRERVRISLP